MDRIKLRFILVVVIHSSSCFHHNEIDLQSNLGNGGTKTNSGTPAWLQTDNSSLFRKIHYRTRSNAIPTQFSKEDFGNLGYQLSAFVYETITELAPQEGLTMPIFAASDQVEHAVSKKSLKGRGKSTDTLACGVNEKRHYERYIRTFMKVNDRFLKLFRHKRSASKTDSEIAVLNKAAKGELASRRRKGFTSQQYYIETLVVADTSMFEHHGDDLEHYILMLMKVANRVFSHPSLGNAITINVVKIIRAGSDLQVSTNARRTLRDFCEWQTNLNTPDDSDPNHYDLAVLLTRKDLCGAECDTLGMADVGSMCSSQHSCAVIEDDGLSAAYTIAHEVGHVMNMMHDDNKLCRINFADINPSTHIMSSTMNRIDSYQPWSTCSKEAVTDFLESGHGSCLLDKPKTLQAFPKQLPGEVYDVNAQCKMSFGPGAIECPFMQECERLWCHTPGGAHQCHTRHFPRADGTACGRGLHCYQGRCIAVGDALQSKDGHWGEWGPFSECSRTCGGGVQMSSRECNDPIPENGGKYCIGARLRFRSCRTSQCTQQGSYVDFRAEQCALYDGKSFPRLGVNVESTWVPKYSDVSGNDRCKLTCQSVQTGVFVILGSKVVDGTRCSSQANGICVQGICMDAGCDGILGSKTKFDNCGTCGGRNRDCKRYKGVYKKKKYGYNDVVKIPAGAASVQIIQRGFRKRVADGNYLAMKDWSGRYLLNGGLTLSTLQKAITVNGTVIRYSGVANAIEKIQISGQISGELQVQVLSLGVGTKGRILPPRIKYIYYKTKTSYGKAKHANSTAKVVSRKMFWDAGRWSDCKPKLGDCGSGYKTREVVCKGGNQHNVLRCESRAKPYDRLPCYKPCNTSPNRFENRDSPPQTSGISTRIHVHYSSLPQMVSRINSKSWRTGRWGPCSKSCGKGTKFRNVSCQSQSGQLLPDNQCHEKKPFSQHGCMFNPC